MDYAAKMVIREELVDEVLSWAQVLEVRGELDIGAADWFSQAIDERLREEPPLVIDLSKCQYLDSTILNVLIRTANAEPGRIGIVVPSAARIRRIFNIAGLEDALQLCETREALQGRFST
jgi:anti-anti-sigma factor